MMGQITEDFVQRAMRCCQLGQHPSLTVWETRQLLTAWVEWQGCRDERDKLDEANRICEQWRQWTVATRAENEALRAEVERLRGIVQADLEEKAEACGEVERLKAALTKWDNSLCGCCCHACTELGNVAGGLPANKEGSRDA